MRFRSVRIDGFGALADREFDFSPGVTLIVGANEAGKSTLQKCLLALLYGLNRRGKGTGTPTETSEWAFLQPWDKTANYAASGRCVLHSGQEIHIIKDFSKRERTKTQVIAAGRDVTANLSRDRDSKDIKIGDHFLELAREEFETSALIKQYDVRWREGACKPLASRVEALVDTAGKETAGEAMRILEKTISEKVGTARTTKRPLDQVGEELAKKRKELRESEDAHGRAMETWATIERLETRIEQAERQVREYEELARLGELLRCEAEIERIADAKRKVTEFRRRLAGLGPPLPRERDESELKRGWEEYQRSRWAMEQAQRQLDESRTELSKGVTELEGIADRLWQRLVELELLDGRPPRAAGLEASELREALNRTENALDEGVTAERQRREEVTSRLRKEHLRRAGSSAFICLLGLAVISVGILGGKSGAAILGALLAAGGAAGLISLPILARRYRRALSRLPDFGEMQGWLEDFRRARSDVESRLDRVDRLAQEEAEAKRRVDEIAARLGTLLRSEGATGETPEELKEDHERLAARRRDRDSVVQGLNGASKRLDELTADGDAEELTRRADELRKNLPDLDVLRSRYKRDEQYLDREREAREEAAGLKAELKGRREEAKALIRQMTPPGKLRSEIARLVEQEKKLEAFRDSLNLARSVLALVAGGTHARWSRSLNAAASAIVEGLTEGRYSSVTFGDDLSPAVERPDGRQVMEGQLLQECLSEGTQDLLYFAARVAVAKELSSTKEPLPLILDDPLVALDDDRRARVLSLLAKTAREVQVIAFTCREEYAPELRVLCEKEGVSFSCIRL